MAKQGSKMKKCAREWNAKSAKYKSTHSYRAHAKKCLKGKR